MHILDVKRGHKKKAIISLVAPKDFKLLTRKRYYFTWKSLEKSATIYKLLMDGEDDILGVMALIDHPDEKRIEIKLLANAVENKGKNKRYDRIAGCLIAYACSLSANKYGNKACVSLVPKTELIGHYMKKYGMLNAGWQLYLESDQLENILNKYYYGL